jgi:hypothetical protein
MIADLFRLLFFREHDDRGISSVELLGGAWPRKDAPSLASRRYEPCRHCGTLVSGSHSCQRMRDFHAPQVRHDVVTFKLRGAVRS